MEALEAACFALHAPPTQPDAQRKRAEAEAVLEHFKRSPHALQDAMATIQSTSHPVVQFHCVATIREVTLKKWSALSMADKAQSLDFMMTFLWQHYAQLERYVSSAMLQAVVLLMKRGWLERAAAERDAIIQQMGSMLNASSASDSAPDDAAASITTRLIAAKWLLAFVTEFSSASRASAMFQPVEFHTKSRKALEKQGLKELLGFAIQLLEDLIRTTTMCSTQDASSGSTLLNVPKQQLELLETAFTLCVETLNWNFTDPMMGNLTWSLSSSSSSSSGGSEKLEEGRAVLTPPTSWRDVLIRPELIHSAFNTYAFFRNLSTRNENLLHLARQFLIQLASLQGPIFTRKEEQVQFLSEIFRGTSALIHNPFLELIGKTDYAAFEIATREMIDMCQLLFRLVNNIGLKALVQSSSSSAPIFASLLEEMSSLSCKLLQSALERIQQHLRLRNNEPVEDLWQLEGVDILLDAWVALANDPFLEGTGSAMTPAASTEIENVSALLSKYSAPVVELYLQTQLEICAVEALAEQDENEDVEDDSASGLREQVELAAALARMNAASSSALLLSLLQSFVANIQQGVGALNGRDEMTPELSQVFEKLHFTVLFSGLFLADEYVSERPCIPQRIHAAIRTGSSSGTADAPSSSQVINLLLLLMSQLLEFEANRVVQNPTSNCISPFFSEQLFSTITRLCATYLAPDALTHDDAIAPELLQVFGFQSGGRAGELINFIVQQCTSYLIHWPTQPVVMQNLMEFLLVLSKTNAISCVLHSSFWQALVQANASAGTFLMAASGGGGDPLLAAVARIPSALRGQLTEALCRAGMTSEDDTMRKTHFDVVARPVEARLQSLIALPNFESKQTANDVRVQEELKLILEMYSGIARSTESKSHGLISAFCLPALPVIVKLFHLFRGDTQIVQLTLSFFCFLVEAQICYLTPADALQVYTASNDLIHTYCRHNLGKVSVLADAEEESYADLYALLQLLSHLVSKDFIDFSDHTAQQADVDNATGIVAEVVFAGLSQVIPMMTEQLLQYPNLSKQYFTLVSYMVEVYAEKLALLDTNLFSMLLTSLLFGIRHVQVDVARYSFQAIGELAGFHWKARHQKNEPGLEKHLAANPDVFLHFIRVIFRMAMFEDFNPVILDACSGALYPLILIEQARYFALAEEISKEQSDEASQQRLLAAFGALTAFLTPADIAMATASTRTFRTQFKTNLFVFVADVRGFIQVK